MSCRKITREREKQSKDIKNEMKHYRKRKETKHTGVKPVRPPPPAVQFSKKKKTNKIAHK